MSLVLQVCLHLGSLAAFLQQGGSAAFGVHPRSAVHAARLSFTLHASPPSAALPHPSQAYAPLQQLRDRVLMLFGCTSKGCGHSSTGCWQALRCQLPAVGAAPPAPATQSSCASQLAPPTQAGHPLHAGGENISNSTSSTVTAAAFDASGSFAGDWSDGFAAAPQAPASSTGGDMFDVSALTASLAATAKQQKAHQQKQQQQQHKRTQAAAQGTECWQHGCAHDFRKKSYCGGFLPALRALCERVLTIACSVARVNACVTYMCFLCAVSAVCCVCQLPACALALMAWERTPPHAVSACSSSSSRGGTRRSCRARLAPGR